MTANPGSYGALKEHTGGGLKKTKKAADMTTKQMVQGLLGVVQSL